MKHLKPSQIPVLAIAASKSIKSDRPQKRNLNQSPGAGFTWKVWFASGEREMQARQILKRSSFSKKKGHLNEKTKRAARGRRAANWNTSRRSLGEILQWTKVLPQSRVTSHFACSIVFWQRCNPTLFRYGSRARSTAKVRHLLSELTAASKQKEQASY